jgi:hypothetical protein
MLTIALKLSASGSWNVCHSRTTIFSDLRLGPAITLAKVIARDEHLRSGRHICVEMPGSVSTIVLARYSDSHDVHSGVALAA